MGNLSLLDFPHEVVRAHFKVVEGVESTWNYHLQSISEPGTASFCGRQTFQTSLRVTTWGFKSGHLPESYCSACEQAAVDHLAKVTEEAIKDVGLDEW